MANNHKGSGNLRPFTAPDTAGGTQPMPVKMPPALLSEFDICVRDCKTTRGVVVRALIASFNNLTPSERSAIIGEYLANIKGGES